MAALIRTVIADDHAIVRHGLAQILEKSGEVEIVAQFANGTDALKWFHKHDCDVLVLDIAMPGMSGVELLKQLREIKPKFPVLIISAYPEDQYAVRLIKAGAVGYLNKECAPDEVVAAVRRVASGRKYISPAVVEMLTNELSMPSEKFPHEMLSNREYQIFLFLASAKSVTEIADALHLSSKTISTYRSRILEKMHLHNNLDLMRYAVNNRLIEQS